MECKVSELVKRGHDQAAELKSSCGAVDVREVAQLISDMATQLDVQLARSNALAAENGQMLRLLTDISENHDEYVNQDEYLYAGVPMEYVSEINTYVSRDVEAENPFKETDAFLAEVRASGVEMLADHLSGMNISASETSVRDFATQIRKGVQS